MAPSIATKLDPVSAVQKVYDFMVWMFPHLAKFPKEHKFTLGESIKERTLNVLELAIDAQYAAEKVDSLTKANRRIEVLRYLLRASYDLKCLSLKQHEQGLKLLYNAGVEVGGWLKQQQAKRGTRR